MSTLLYGVLSGRRQATASSLDTESTSPPGVKTTLDALAALVPAEVLAMHAAVLPWTTETRTVDGQQTTVIVETAWLRASFWLLMLVAILLYLTARRSAGKVVPLDLGRALIPAAAFVGWTMAQRATAFDAVAPGFDETSRALIPLFAAVVLGALATWLGVKAAKADPPA